MRQNELIVYRNMEDGELLHDMAWIMTYYDVPPDQVQDTHPRRTGGKEWPRDREGMTELFYDCIHRLIELAGRYGFHGNLWHCYLTNLLVNNENSYSCGCEIRGEIEGTINEAALHDIVIFKEFFDYDFTGMVRELNVTEFSMIRNGPWWKAMPAAAGRAESITPGSVPASASWRKNSVRITRRRR